MNHLYNYGKRILSIVIVLLFLLYEWHALRLRKKIKISIYSVCEQMDQNEYKWQWIFLIYCNMLYDIDFGNCIHSTSVYKNVI